MVLPTPHDREGELVRLRHQLGPGGFAAVHRTSGGSVRVFGRAALAVWDGGHWWAKPYSGAYARAVLRTVPEASPESVEAILEFCVHSMSPAPAGATLVWALDDSVVAELAQHGGRRIPPVSLEDRTNHGPLRQMLAQTDGAALLAPSAELVDVGVYLRSSPEAYAAIGEDPAHGTRHASARRYSFDHAAALVFVVSHDGPVTVYFKGKVVASIRSRLQEEATDEGEG
jgi:DNA integrity scanning protein DisA with diadenylate cyclase activity